jgi:hypothetical protein
VLEVFFPIHDREWGPLIEFSLDSLTKTGYIFIDVKAQLTAESGTAKGALAGEITHGEEQLSWRGATFSSSADTRHQFTATNTFHIQVMLRNEMEMKGRTMRIYLWNPDKTACQIDQIDISWRKANPYRYALFSDFSAE